ncbi:hypothetical protein SAMN03159341_14122 [Paenibacillus sp. 1_12]|uniref:hypothetical protein n=1 Tax=Paenibacillus sp. 1_12 TaxID=1566278 RepID=UPI0008E2D84D|nr:hypothetical protein [Paenibacillus sp. 1_12]SFM51718.1 hypothetical protein SAMN03159341_14122 [Paenibacillus sp. 1_12]
MPRGKKVRRIDYGRKEMMGLSEINIPQTFTNYMNKFYELYGFEETDFRVGKSENADYYFPADFAELLALVLRNSSKHPFIRVNHVKENVNASQIQEYNQLMCESIDNELPSVFRDLIYTMPSHLQSVKLGDLTSVLVERLTLFIMNITKLEHQAMGDTVDWLCRQLDQANYNLFRDNYFFEMGQKSNEAYDNEHNKELIEKLHGPKNEKVDDIERRMVATNNSIDYTISLLIKRILHETNELYHGEKGFEYLDLENKTMLLMLGLEAMPADESNSDGQESHLIERTLYYNHEMSKAVNQGRVAMAESVLEGYREKILTRKSIVDQIKDKSFREPGEMSINEKKKILESQIKEMQEELARLDAEASEPQNDFVDSFMAEMKSKYVEHCEKANQDSEKLKPIVDHFVGQVLTNFMNSGGIK